MPEEDYPTRLLIQEWRKARGLTQRQLARALGISARTLARWERRCTNLRLSQLDEVAAMLHIHTGMLFPQDPEVLWTDLHDGFDHVNDQYGIARLLIQAMIQVLRQPEADTPLEQQKLATFTRTWQRILDRLWYILCCRQAAAHEERQRLQQAITAIRNAADRHHTGQSEGHRR